MQRIDKRLEDFTVLNVIGTGSFGTCYKVLKRDSGEIFVWKAIDYGQMTEEKKKFLVSEVNLLNDLCHPNIVRYYDRIIHKPTTTIYIIMEWCAGGDLCTLISDCKKTNTWFEERFIWRVLYQLSRALHACHCHLSQGPVLHRDIKPANVFLDGNGHVKLGDFGLAYLLQVGTHFSDRVVGTPFYMSPEAINDGFYSEKSDVWSLGCLVYELCTLHPPFDGSSLRRLIRCIKEGSFEKIPSRYSEDLFNIICFMLNTEQKARPTIEAVLQHPKLVMNMVQNSLEDIKNRDNSYVKDMQDQSLINDSLPSTRSSNSFNEEVVKIKDALATKMEELKLWEEELRIREIDIAEREKGIAKREKAIVLNERLAKDKVVRAEMYLRHCHGSRSSSGSIHNYIRNHKIEVDNTIVESSFCTDQGDTSIMPATSAKLNPMKVEKPVLFTGQNSERHVHFGTLPNIKPKSGIAEGNMPQNSHQSISHILIHGVNLPQGYAPHALPLTNRVSNESIRGTKTRRPASSTGERSSSHSSGTSRSTVVENEQARWLEHKRAMYLESNKENVPIDTKSRSRLGEKATDAKTNMLVKKMAAFGLK